MCLSNSSAFLEFFLRRYAEEPEVEVPISEELAHLAAAVAGAVQVELSCPP
jgi:hypothetical protein